MDVVADDFVVFLVPVVLVGIFMCRFRFASLQSSSVITKDIVERIDVGARSPDNRGIWDVEDFVGTPLPWIPELRLLVRTVGL